MTKAEFLEELENKLNGEVDSETVRRNLRYYDGYIKSAVREGRAESEILEELGSPLLIARTIIDTQSQGNYGGSYGQGTEPDQEENYRALHPEVSDKRAKLRLLLIVIAVLIVLFTVLRILLPILIPVLLVILVVNLVKKQ